MSVDRENDVETISDNLRSVRESVREACEQSNRSPEDVRICAVTKNRTLPNIRALTELDLFFIGENRVQEAERKLPYLSEEFRCDFIGHLQRNKCSFAVQIFDRIQSVDRAKIVETLRKQCEKRDLTKKVFVQVNVSGEESKHGVDPSEVSSVVDDLHASNHLVLDGFMTVAPYVEDPEQNRSCFRQLHEIRAEEADRCGKEPEQLELSMGMSQDFPVAVEEGATIIRPGRAIFE